MSPIYDLLPHPDVEAVPLRKAGIDAGQLDPQETWFDMADGKILLFYPDEPPVRVERNGAECYRLHIANEDQAFFVKAAAVREVKSLAQKEVGF